MEKLANIKSWKKISPQITINELKRMNAGLGEEVEELRKAVECLYADNEKLTKRVENLESTTDEDCKDCEAYMRRKAD